MAFESILKNISRFASLTLQEEEAFCALLAIKKVKRKEFILREGDICTAEYFVNKGCLRTYFVDKKGFEHNLYFAIEDWWISDLYSRTQMAPTYSNIVARGFRAGRDQTPGAGGFYGKSTCIGKILPPLLSIIARESAPEKS